MKLRYDKLTYWFTHIDKIFKDKKKFVLGENDERRIFVDRGSKHLFVAHLDTVLPAKIHHKKNFTVTAQGLDDRLGCYIAWELGKELSVDVLLTDNEELCQSSAQYHEHPSMLKYNFIVEFDRAGYDVVTYGIDSPDFLAALESYFTVGYGSYSDIYHMDTVCCAVNIGIGYDRAHQKNSQVNLDKLQEQLNKFMEFWDEYSHVEFPFDELFGSEYIKPRYKPMSTGLWHGTSAELFCDICHCDTGNYIHGYRICGDCFQWLLDETGALSVFER